MTYLPIEHKYLIQTSYVRVRELAKEIPEIRNKVTVGQFAHWGGLAVVILGLVRSIIGNSELPNFVGGIALLCLTFGWAYKSDAKKKQRELWDERQSISKSMKAIGIWFSEDTFGRGGVTVHIDNGNAVSPLIDESYR